MTQKIRMFYITASDEDIYSFSGKTSEEAWILQYPPLQYISHAGNSSPTPMDT